LQSTTQAGLRAEDVPRLSLKWAFGFPDATSAWSQPTIASGRLFVGSQNGTVYSLDAKSGCIYWTFTAKSGVRTALAFGRLRDAYAVYFGDTGANVYALDAATGRELWTRELDAHPHARITGSPSLYQGRLFVPVASIEETAASQQGYECCTFRGSLNALDAQTGEVVWRTFMVPEPQPAGKNAAGVQLYGPAGVGIWAAPTIDVKRNLVYAATGNTYSAPAQPTADAIVAIDPTTGAIKWIKQFTAQDVFGCRAGTPNCGREGRTRLRPRHARDAHHLPRRPRRHHRRAEVRDDVRDRSRQGRRDPLAVPRRRRIDLGRRAMGRGGGRRSRVLSGVGHRTPKPGGLHAVTLTSGERAWYIPPLPLKCADRHRLQRRAHLGADAPARRALFRIERRRAARALDQGRVGDLGVRHQPQVRNAQRRARRRRRHPGSRTDDRGRDALSQLRLR
jgi:hypothetical protein